MTNTATPTDRVKRYFEERLEGIVRRQVAEVTSDSRDAVVRLELEVQQLGKRVAWLENEIHRLGPHVAAQGERIGVLEQGYRPVADADARNAAQEHARARARGALILEFEERINRLELLLMGQADE